MEVKSVDLTTINNGAAVELFKEEFEKVMRNINDISVNSDAPREIKLVIKIKPTKDRLSAITTIQASSKLATITEHQSSIFISKNQAYVTNPYQEEMSFMNKKGE